MLGKLAHWKKGCAPFETPPTNLDPQVNLVGSDPTPTRWPAIKCMRNSAAHSLNRPKRKTILQSLPSKASSSHRRRPPPPPPTKLLIN